MKTIVHIERERMDAVIRSCNVCFVGMADTDGTPYVLPMNFAYLNGVVYFHSAQEGRKTDILERNPNVCITFCSVDKLVCQHPDVACSYSMHAISVIAWGKVSYETDLDKKTEILHILMKQYTAKTVRFAAPALRNVKIWKVSLDKLTCKETGVSSK